MKPIALRKVVLSAYASAALLWLGLPLTLTAHGDLHDRIESVTKAIEKKPSDPGLYLERGQLHGLHGQWDAALADFARVSHLDPHLIAVEFCKGQMLFDAGRYEEAERCLSAFLTVEPNHATALATRARTLVKLEHPIAAAADFSRAITATTEPKPEYYIERAQALASTQAGRIGDGIDGLEQGIKEMGPVFTLQFHALELEIKAKRYDEALKRLDQIAASSNRKERWAAQRAEILESAGRTKEAYAAYARAFQLFEALPPARKKEPAMVTLGERLRKVLQRQSGSQNGI